MDPGLLIFAGMGLYLLLLMLMGGVAERDLEQNRRKQELASVGPAFKAAGRQLGLQVVRARRLRGARIEGAIDGSRVVAQCAARGLDPWLTTITVWPRSGLPNGFWLRSRWRTGMSPTNGTPNANAPAVETGDPVFDSLVDVRGRPAVVHVLLSAPVRQAITALARTGTVRLLDGTLVHETLERIWSAGQLITLVRNSLAAAQAFPQVSDGGAMLAEAAHSDPEPGVRARCLDTLVAEEPDQPRTAAALDRALTDPSDAVRVVAARALGESGLPVLREIATRSDSEEEPAARAISLLARRLSSSETIALLDSAVSASRTTVALAAIELLGRTGDAPACERLQAALRCADADLAVAAADALGLVHSPAAEQALLQAIESRHLEVRHAAVLALGRVGRLASIAHLTALLDANVEPTFASAARQAIAAIQARIPGASPGQVSLTEGQAGDLSLAENDASGHLSLPAKPGAH